MNKSECTAISAAGRQLSDIITIGKRTPGMNAHCGPKSVPTWFEPETFAHAQHLYRLYGLITALTSYYGLLFGIHQSDAFLPLLTTGNSKSIYSLFLRYISTGRHVRLWLQSDPFDSNSEAYKSLKTVRGLHSQVYEKLNRESGKIANGTTQLWMSQYAMAGAQFSFFGLMTLFPKQLGYQNFTPKDFHAINHFWRTIGYCMGIEDRFNICTGSDEQIHEICKLIFYGRMEPSVRDKCEPTGVAMCKGICQAFSYFSPLLSYNVLMRYHAKSMSNFNAAEFPLVTLAERFHYWFLVFLMQTLSGYSWITCLLTKLFHLLNDFHLNYLSFYEQIFEEKYSGITFPADRRCPFNIKINYKANV